LIGAGHRNRTYTTLRSPDFESGASASSASPAREIKNITTEASESLLRRPSRWKRKDVYKNHLGCWCAKLDTSPFGELVRSCTRRSHGRYPANRRSRSTRKDKSKPSPPSLRLRGRGQMPEVKSGRVHILHQLAVPGGVAAEDTGNYLLLSLTRRSQRCRSGSEISGAGLHQRQGARRWCRSVEGCGILDELNDRQLI
jgi:hypothetical protein